MEKQLFLIPFICFLSMCTNAQDIKQKEVTRIVSTLAADNMEGRKTFTPGAEKAATFIEAEFAKAKLSPLPGNTNFRQSFYHYKVIRGISQLTINGHSSNDRIVVSGAAHHLQWNQDSAVERIQVKASDNFYDYFGRKYKSNTIIWIDTAHSKEFIHYHENMQHSRQVEDSSVSVVYVLTAEPEIKTWEVKADQQVSRVPLYNIIGMIRGTTKPEEYVIFSAHYDHLGIIDSPVDGDSIANGADDDASGVTAIISMAAYYKKQPAPARTLLFIAFTGEEMGGYGAHYYAKYAEPDKIIAMFNIDMLGKVSKFGKNSIFLTGYERSDFGAILNRNVKGSAFHVYPDPYPEQHLFYRADNAELARLGVPAHTISTARIDTDSLYHNVRDEVKTLDLQNLTNVIKGIINSARSIVNGTDTPKRIDRKNV